jgi:hypothetical protein
MRNYRNRFDFSQQFVRGDLKKWSRIEIKESDKNYETKKQMKIHLLLCKYLVLIIIRWSYHIL